MSVEEGKRSYGPPRATLAIDLGVYVLKARLLLAGLLLVAFVLSAPAGAVNRVTVQSKTFRVNSGPDTVGIFLENDVSIVGVVVPIEMRAVSGEAFTRPPFTNSTFKWQEVPTGRLANSPLGLMQDPEDRWLPAFVWADRFAVAAEPTDEACSGPSSNTYSHGAVQCDGITPDGLCYSVISVGDPDLGEEISLTPGVDVTPSLEIIFPVNGNPGTFEIDTCCMRPANHLNFVNENYVSVSGIQFTKGIITLVPCACDCFADPVCDSNVSDVLDVVGAIAIAFRNAVETADPNPDCPKAPSDVDCSGATDAVDIVKIINVAFRNGNPATEYCNPCQ